MEMKIIIDGKEISEGRLNIFSRLTYEEYKLASILVECYLENNKKSFVFSFNSITASCFTDQLTVLRLLTNLHKRYVCTCKYIRKGEYEIYLRYQFYDWYENFNSGNWYPREIIVVDDEDLHTADLKYIDFTEYYRSKRLRRFY